MKNCISLALLLTFLIVEDLGYAVAQEFFLETKGKKSPPVLCAATLVGFDGSAVKIAQSADSATYKAAHIVPCAQTSLSPSELDITIALPGAPDTSPPVDPDRMILAHFGGYQNQTDPSWAVLDTGSPGAASMQLKTKDVGTQQVEVEQEIADRKKKDWILTTTESSRAPIQQFNVFGGKNLAIADLTKCKGRYSDWIVTLVGGSPTRISGTIGSIADGWVLMKPADKPATQRFSLWTVSMIGIGSCPE